MNHFYHLPHMGEDYFTYSQLYHDMVQNCAEPAHFVELGGFKGKSTAYLAVEIINSNKSIKLDCVDLFVNCPQGSGIEIQECFIANIKPVKHIVNLIIKDSAEASKDYDDESLSFVFVDADHTFDGVKKDIIGWLPKVKSGGVLAGHDFEWDGVRTAVLELLPHATTYKQCTDCWYIIK